MDTNLKSWQSYLVYVGSANLFCTEFYILLKEVKEYEVCLYSYKSLEIKNFIGEPMNEVFINYFASVLYYLRRIWLILIIYAYVISFILLWIDTAKENTTKIVWHRAAIWCVVGFLLWFVWAFIPDEDNALLFLNYYFGDDDGSIILR